MIIPFLTRLLGFRVRQPIFVPAVVPNYVVLIYALTIFNIFGSWLALRDLWVIFSGFCIRVLVSAKVIMITWIFLLNRLDGISEQPPSDHTCCFAWWWINWLLVGEICTLKVIEIVSSRVSGHLNHRYSFRKF